jgi:hypothetical protein
VRKRAQEKKMKKGRRENGKICREKLKQKRILWGATTLSRVALSKLPLPEGDSEVQHLEKGH